MVGRGFVCFVGLFVSLSSTKKSKVLRIFVHG
jgi:hypothetical protein